MNRQRWKCLTAALVIYDIAIRLSVTGSVHAAEESDAVALALQQARTTHRTAVTDAEEAFLKSVNAELKAVAAKGDLGRTKALLAEKMAFEAGTGPVTQSGLLTEINRYLAQLRSADRALLSAYERAVENYTKQLSLDAATAVREEQKLFEAWQSEGYSADAEGILKGAVLLWTFDSSEMRTEDGATFVDDLSARENDGRIVGHRLIPRKPGTAVLFDKRGTSLVSEKNIGITGKQPRTFAMWINIGMPGRTRMDSMFGWGVSNQSEQFRWGYWNNRYRLWTYGDATTRGLFDAVRGWHHVTVTYDGTTLSAYRNGAPDGAVSYVLDLNTKDSRVVLNESFVGAIDEVIVLSRALNPVEVKKLFDQSRRGLGRPTGSSRRTRGKVVAHRRSLWPPQPADNNVAP